MNLITCAFAFKEGFQTSRQLNKTAGSYTTEMYLKNLYVALASARALNPQDDVYLSVNYEINEDWVKRFEAAGVIVRVMDFSSFVVPKEFPWSLAFFKMCVLDTWVSEGKYDRYLILDADTYTARSYGDLWKESDFGILLYPLGHSFSHPDRETIRKDFIRLLPEDASGLPITHYGGEFIGGNRADLTVFMNKCRELFDKLSREGFKADEKIGDEDLWSIAATLLNRQMYIIPATPYNFRFWTREFYLISTVTVSNPVCVWHLPAEKENGIIRLYNYRLKKGSFPTPERAAALLGISPARRPLSIRNLQDKINGKLRKWTGK